MVQHYAFQGYEPNHMARAAVTGLSISTKQSVNVCAFVKDKPLARAKKELAEVIELKRPVPYFRYHRDTPHQHGPVASGRFPVKVCEEVARLLRAAENNAQQKGLNPAALIVKHICAHKGANSAKGGRNRGRVRKHTHLEVVLAEAANAPKVEKKKPAKNAPAEKKAEPAAEKKEAPKAEAKPAEPAPSESPKKETEEKKE